MSYNTFLTIIVPSLIAFAVTVIGTRFLMNYFYGAGIVGEDRNKEKVKKIAGSGGMAVALGIIVGILTYTFGGSFIFLPQLSTSKLLAVALSIILIALVGLLDDINVKARRVQTTDMRDIRKGLKQWQKPLLTLMGALPLMAINAGVSTLNLPFLGAVSLGYLYPLLLIPLAVIFVSNSFNLLGGFDGLQPGMAGMASLGLLVYSLLYGNYTGTLLSALLLASVLAFLPFNMYKAKILPGDSFTYAVGGTLVAIMVMGNAETFGIIIFIPWIIEFFLHLRKKFNVTDLGIRQKDGTFKAPYGKRIYSLTHVVMNMKRATEVDVASYLTNLEGILVVVALLLKGFGLL
jgi:UDP-N-acetylglucosamine--dolichyl-phosphate N-acetylglucosaminephosphotransferase